MDGPGRKGQFIVVPALNEEGKHRRARLQDRFFSQTRPGQGAAGQPQSRRRSLDFAELLEFDRGFGIPVQADHSRTYKKEIQRLAAQGVQLAIAYGSNLSLLGGSSENVAVFNPRELLSILVINIIAHLYVPFREIRKPTSAIAKTR
jgi:hypothetical protein